MSEPIAASLIAAQAFRFMEISPISSFADSSQQAQAARDTYTPARDMVLTSYDWSIARQLAHLPEILDGTVFTDPDLPHAYHLPDSALLLRHVYSDRDWRLDGRIIRTTTPAPLKIRYTRRIDREADLPATLSVAIALQLAVLLSPAYVGSRTKRADLDAQLSQALAVARQNDNHSSQLQQFDPDSTAITSPWAQEAVR